MEITLQQNLQARVNKLNQLVNRIDAYTIENEKIVYHSNYTSLPDLMAIEKRGRALQADVQALNLNYKSFIAWAWNGLTGKGFDVKYN